MFEATFRDGFARLGRWDPNGTRVNTPFILGIDVHGLSHRVSPSVQDLLPQDVIPVPAELADRAGIPHPGPAVRDGRGPRVLVVSGPDQLGTYEDDEVPEVIALANSNYLWRDPSRLVRTVVEVRSLMRFDQLLYLPGVATPANVPFLQLLGVDLIDPVQMAYAAVNGIDHTVDGGDQDTDGFSDDLPGFTDLDGNIRMSGMSTGSAPPAALTPAHLFRGNLRALSNSVDRSCRALKRGLLRNLVESGCALHIDQTQGYRVFNRISYEHVERSTPAWRKSPVLATTECSLAWPEVVRFRERVIKRYRAPGANTLILLPCSAKKPYSQSRSHNLFREAVGRGRSIHEVMVTSPMGLVPRELERFHPAGNYDIPVTGEWSANEREMLTDLLKRYLENNSYDRVVVHLDEGHRFLEDVLPDAEWTVDGRATSEGSLEALSKAASAAPERGPSRFDYARSRLRFQFPEGWDTLLEDCEINGAWWKASVQRKGDLLGFFDPDRGFFISTIPGGQAMIDAGINVVEIGDFKPTSNIMAPGVVAAGDWIRPGDEVVAAHEDEIRAVGTAVMSGPEMVESQRGAAIRVRERAYIGGPG